jgi:heme-degrading monooxygenase HmoA
MFVAMNRFRIAPGREEAFETLWRARDSRLAQVEGFRSFMLLRGPSQADHTLYVSHSVWADRAAFEAWTRSEHFRHAHASAGDARAMYLGPPKLELLESVVES